MSVERPAFLVDSSVAIKWVVQEEDTVAALDLLSRHHVLVPGLFWAECANILFKKVREKQVARPDAIGIWATLEALGLSTVPPPKGMMATALEISLELDHPAYDCVYLAFARTLGVRFVTADRRLLRTLERNQATGSGSLSDIAVLPLSAYPYPPLT